MYQIKQPRCQQKNGPNLIKNPIEFAAGGMERAQGKGDCGKLIERISTRRHWGWPIW